ncbi:hypothetical protein EVG20_g596 [Dentipellis fragilis]|uniref:C3H1-type domain-containing protein n=1 Tax=Dentipellis fragilis TaxID=205917 RepID=A0A4Y9ZD63_9AGAM|nr:hypothetical protein EVG20_g596 [Dentipellis fragilis]
MVSELWNASSQGDLPTVHALLVQLSSADIEIKDQEGVTPLIVAVKNGHHDVVKALLEKGANPENASVHGVPAQYTSDPAMLELLQAASPPKVNGDSVHPGPVYAHDPSLDPSKGYPMPPPGPYAYYPGMPVPPLPDGSMPYYPQPPPPPPAQAADEQPQVAGHHSNLPPPEIARLIPCRYFPACRYGPSCMFAHPQGPYYQGPMPPPSQYPAPYESMNPHMYQPNFYPMPPPSFQSPNGLPPPHMAPVSPQSAPPSAHPQAPMVHARAASEIVSPVQAPFSPNGAPAAPYGAVSPISPSYPHPGSVAVPMSIPPLPPISQGPLGPQSPPSAYPPPPMAGPPQVHPYDPRRNSIGQYGQPVPPVPGAAPEVNGVEKSHVADHFHPNGHRDMSHMRRGGMRRPSLGRKPPCMFFPSGRCRNGDECRFPHVADSAVPHQPHFPGRGGRFRPPPPMNGVVAIEEKLANLNVRDDNFQRNPVSGNATPPEGPARIHPAAVNKPFNSVPNGQQRVGRPFAPKQRVPNADEFPVLGGSTTPPSRSPAFNGHSNGHAGPTAAQVLQAPPPARKETSKGPASSDGASDSGHSPSVQASKTPEAKPAPVVHQEPVVNKLPISFAAVANGAPDASKEVSVSA